MQLLIISTWTNQSRRITGGTNTGNDGSASYKCPVKQGSEPVSAIAAPPEWMQPWLMLLNTPVLSLLLANTNKTSAVQTLFKCIINHSISK